MRRKGRQNGKNPVSELKESIRVNAEYKKSCSEFSFFGAIDLVQRRISF